MAKTFTDLQMVQLAAQRTARQHLKAGEKKFGTAFMNFAEELRRLRMNQELGVEPTWERTALNG